MSCPFSVFFPLDKSGPWKYWRGNQRSTVTAVVSALSTVGQRELQQSLHVHLVEEFELRGQLMGFLPFGGELGALLVVVVVWQLLTCVWVPAKGPEAIKVDLVTHRRGQRVHQDASAQTLWRQLLGFPVTVNKRRERFKELVSLTHVDALKSGAALCYPT